MNAPDKIYISPLPNPSDGFAGIAWADAHGKMEEYIRKDALLEWANGKKKHYMDRQEYDCGWNDLLEELIDKLDTL